MNKKVLKLFFILLLIFNFCISYVYATGDVNLNLPGIITENNQELQDNLETVNNTDFVNNTTEIPNETDLNNDMDSVLTEGLQPSKFSTTAETELGITNIINILLITVGVILIFLAIAILIRLRG